MKLSLLAHYLYWGLGVVRCKTGEFGGADDWIIRCVRRTHSGTLYIRGAYGSFRPLDGCNEQTWIAEPKSETVTP